MDIMKMRYLIEPRERRYVKGYEFLSFAKNIGKNITISIVKNLLTMKSATDAIKTASKRAIQKTAESTGDLIGNKIADKTTSASMELHSKKYKELPSNEVTNEIPKEQYISRQERQKIIDGLRLI